MQTSPFVCCDCYGETIWHRMNKRVVEGKTTHGNYSINLILSYVSGQVTSQTLLLYLCMSIES